MRSILAILGLAYSLLSTHAAFAQHQGIPTPIDAGIRNGLFGGLTPTPLEGIPGITISPDGRLLLAAWRTGCRPEAGWYVSVLRHENLTFNGQGQVAFPVAGPTAWSPRALVEHSARVAGGQLNSTTPMWQDTWVTMAPDPAFRHLPCPFPSLSSGAYDPGGAFATYQMILIAADQWRLAPGGTTNFSNPALTYYPHISGVCPIPEAPTNSISVNPIGRRLLKVVVANPRTPNATVASVSINSSLEVLYFNSDDDMDPTQRPLLGIEPSLTLDGRLLVFHSSAAMTQAGAGNGSTIIGNVMYSYNPVPGAVVGWSHPKDLSNLFNERNILLDGVRLGSRYPLADVQLFEQDGTPFTGAIAGAYPWISLDGTDVTFTTLFRPTPSTPRVFGVSMIGASTHGRLRHLDGPINPSRYGTEAHFRRLIAATGLDPGAWAWGGQGDKPLPYSPASRALSTLSSERREYAEINLDAGLDRDVLVALDLNEAILGVGTTQAEWEMDLTRTFNTARLGGLAVLLGDAHFTEPDAGQLGYETLPGIYTGVIGECVTFHGTGVVALPAQAELNQARSEAMIAAWIKSGPSTTSVGFRKVFEKGSAFVLGVNGTGQVLAAVRQANGNISLSPVLPSPATTKWTHVALVFNGPESEVSLWIDGASVWTGNLTGTTPHQLEGNGVLLLLGPNGPSSNPSIDTLSVDQFRFDRVARSPSEIARLAHVPEPTVDVDPLPDWFVSAISDTGRDPSTASLPVGSVLTNGTIALGEQLFHDANLSPIGFSCSTCHISSLDFTDGIAQRPGNATGAALRNAPTVLDRLWSDAQFWDGRASSLEDQALVPLFNPEEMASNANFVTQYLSTPGSGSGGGGPDYLTQFSASYGSAPSVDLLAKALASYQRALISKPSPADDFEAGATGTLTSLERHGRNLFFGKARCFACHTGPNFTDEQFHITVADDSGDLGRGGVNGRQRDEFRFKTPTLRHLPQTGPYFHDGSADTLFDVIEVYRRGGDLPGFRDEEIFPLDLTDSDAGALVEYLMALDSQWTRL